MNLRGEIILVRNGALPGPFALPPFTYHLEEKWVLIEGFPYHNEHMFLAFKLDIIYIIWNYLQYIFSVFRIGVNTCSCRLYKLVTIHILGTISWNLIALWIETYKINFFSWSIRFLSLSLILSLVIILTCFASQKMNNAGIISFLDNIGPKLPGSEFKRTIGIFQRKFNKFVHNWDSNNGL